MRYEELEVGGELTTERLRAIAERALYLRNWLLYARVDYMDMEEDGETPVLVYVPGDDGETSWDRIDLEVGCGCTMVICPRDPETDEPDRQMAEAIIHSGRDLLDLVREIRKLREEAERTRETRREVAAQIQESAAKVATFTRAELDRLAKEAGVTFGTKDGAGGAP